MQNYFRLNLFPICIVQIIIFSWGQGLDNAFPALGFIHWLQDQTTMSNSPKRFHIYSVFWLFSAVLLLPAAISSM